MTHLTVIADHQCVFSSIFGTIITSFVVIIGWWVNNSLAKSRQLRNEQLTKKEELFRELDNLDNAIREYYVGEKEKHNSAKHEIDAKFSRLSGMIENLGNASKETKVYERFTALFEATTDGTFETDKISNEVFEEKYKRILLIREQLFSEIETLFNEQVKSPSK